MASPLKGVAAIADVDWPVNSNQEMCIRASHVVDHDNLVTIQTAVDECRIGIMSTDKKPLGFIFAKITLLLSETRREINQQLKGAKLAAFTFLDHNCWPVFTFQEERLTIADIITQQIIYIQFQAPDNSSVAVAIPHSNDTPIKNKDFNALTSAADSIRSHRLFHPAVANLQNRSKAIAVKDNSEKEILISYVRAEAALHALSLKEEFEKLGFSVYLDVHEIKCGVDWQDSLNDAVSSCEVFVPLVTPRYGKTQWTNREIKLADVLGKYVVPVNFLSDWPPACLAIQFATTQFVPWKTTENILKDGNKDDISYWDKVYVVGVAQQIGELCRRSISLSDSTETFDDESSDTQLQKRISMIRSCPLQLFGNASSPMASQEPRDGKPLIILSCHPTQDNIANEIKNCLEEEGYEIVLTSELMADLYKTVNEPAKKKLRSNKRAKISQKTELTEKATKRMRIEFQRITDEACMVIFLLSQAFATSRLCQQQVYYCEHRKRFIPLKAEEFAMPGWLSMLIGTAPLEDVQRKDYKQTLVARVRQTFNREDNLLNDADISLKSYLLRETLPRSDPCVYISGGTKFYSKNTEAICKSIGACLADFDNLSLITGGFYGVGDVLGRSFYNKRITSKKEPLVYHVLPVRDEQDRSLQARQNSDKTFMDVPFGSTIFAGDNVREREIIVSKAISICILIEGGPGAAHEAEQFCWNDHTVIPIKVTGGAAGGKFNVPQQIFEVINLSL
ncbi:uncharacterized protein TRIADDRAFT_60787 [Trichoplax adhaerens]|uniref:TIR domain-containing protein n=1 Tax=Trichoplax adhaerens TaxID=10228 RepID=B3S8Y4_TRIAD|nr:predicted protein [Trichoplax adhaerens]EDV20851.1 predicted protein [Trichoplax adhaerens]|eukprot:XP_002116792.1 predicted protein [Trichoplax adhaerens]